MRNKWILVKKHLPWLVTLLVMDLFFCILLWIADVKALRVLSMVLILTSVMLYVFVLLIVVQREKKYKKTFEDYIISPTEQNEEEVIGWSSESDREIIHLLGHVLKEKDAVNNQMSTRITDYEEYVESWAHEIKTPIALLTILLDNHCDEIPNNVSTKMNYIRNRMQEYVDQILFYARLKGEKKDYLFEKFPLDEIVNDILEDYAPLLEEKKFSVHTKNLEITIFSDKRSLKFLLGQIISNSIKYTKNAEVPELEIYCEMVGNTDTLTIRDNGIGVKACDLPYIFEKGFTGDLGENRKKATGMGLYLAKEIAGYLKLRLNTKSEWMNGFEMKIEFPKLTFKNSSDNE